MEINQKINKHCDMCEDTDATSLCHQCFCYYCDKCFKCIHESKKKSNHKKEVIDYNVPIDTRCSIHERNFLNLFCLNEKGNSYISIKLPYI